MDTIILGFLMIQASTIYELRQSIKNSLSTVSSDSTGSIQAALKKLLSKNLITFEEQVEGGLNKKIYFITDAGKDYFQESISQPMLYKEKNMELSKFFFMGFTDPVKRDEMLANYIQVLEEELASLERINASIGLRYQFDDTVIQDLKKRGGAIEYMDLENIKSIAHFQYATLDLGIEKAKFEIEWFKKFRKRLASDLFDKPVK
ncbi:PadR family transcriptional regulator [Enterococcus raffinosus]|uniref:PadR family transcriptional regulator n=1 Tax=Enterococcus raffinosus TaxID=71452 RepID=A0AAW8T8N3_9ENTE|nr:PadR family transcriptional regulator [Enterococcus raffinosus]MDT2522475.1 PadR family transcriptional regulator [Enterococcus raffinosus]MDT2530434.1 PadR family transcriptional regulator [Enterococcus raffinosus]MDT2533608.1 PadR family transcriptional regulator [Enterococcus raffinosus]MDT2543105.1 PadR family transcriptional regulator [Enterococcus raffinosus]MDT2553153.1 PadR family transcriptional regulator [Enterococcus raffinosus]